MERTPLDVTALRSRLVTPVGRLTRLDLVEVTGSTNADLLARHSAGEDIRGAVLAAEHQTAGRGRLGRSWSAPPSSQIALSVGVDAGGVDPKAWGWLPLLTGVAVVDALEETGVGAGLKWPNDVMVGAGKLAGILAEVAAPDPVIVVGLGLNVTLTAHEAPDPRATSLLMLGSSALDRTTLLAGVLERLMDRVAEWISAGGHDAALIEDYRRHSLTLSTPVRAVLPGDREIIGTATQVDEIGRLLIDTGSQTVTVSAGDITHLRSAD